MARSDAKQLTTVLVLGGGGLLVQIAEYLQRAHAVRTVVLSSKRHLEAKLESGGTLRERLDLLGVEVVDVPKLDAAALRSLDLDLSCTAAFSTAAPWIVKQDVIDLLGGRIYNLHGARLPQDRGGATASWNIMRGQTEGVALMHKVDAGIDTGDIIDSHGFSYLDCRTPLDYQHRYDAETMLLVQRVMPAILEGNAPPGRPQSDEQSSYWPRLNTDIQGWIDWSWSGLDIARFVAAFDEPYAGAQTMLGDRVVRLKECQFDRSEGEFHPFQAGLIYRVTATEIAICATTGSLRVGSVRDADGARIEPDGVQVGDRLVTPAAKLEAAMRSRVRYTPTGLSTQEK